MLDEKDAVQQATDVAKNVSNAAADVADTVSEAVDPAKDLLSAYTVFGADLWGIFVHTVLLILIFYVINRMYYAVMEKSLIRKGYVRIFVGVGIALIAFVIEYVFPIIQEDSLKLVLIALMIMTVQYTLDALEVRVKKLFQKTRQRTFGHQFAIAYMRIAAYFIILFITLGFYHEAIGKMLDLHKFGIPSEWVMIGAFAVFTPTVGKIGAHIYLVNKHVGFQDELLKIQTNGLEGFVMGRLNKISLRYVEVIKRDGMPATIDINNIKKYFENLDRRTHIPVEPWPYYIDVETDYENIAAFCIAVKKLITDRDDCECISCRPVDGVIGYHTVRLIFQVSKKVNNFDNVVRSVAQSIATLMKEHQIKEFRTAIIKQ